jgi:hypothetical protein
MFVGFVVKVCVIGGVAKLFFNDGHYGAVIEIEHEASLCPRVFHTMVKRNIDIDGRLLPSCVFFLPFMIELIGRQVIIDIRPFRVTDVLRFEIGIAHDVQKRLETLLGFLNAVIPIPLPKKKRIFVRIRIETGAALRRDCGWFFIAKIIDGDELFGVVLGAFCRVIPPPESKDISCRLEKF